MRVLTHQGISNQELLYGFQPIDFVILLLFPLFFSIFTTFFVGIVFFVILFLLCRKFRNRLPFFFSQFIAFKISARYFSISADEVLPYSLYAQSNVKPKITSIEGA
jgi:hypothetical protein